MNFTEFKSGLAGSVFAGLGKEWPTRCKAPVASKISASRSSSATPKDIGLFVTALRRYAGTCSSGEFRLLLAICTVVDFGHLADDLADGKAWQDLVMGCDRRFRVAIAGVRDGGAVRNGGPQATRARKGRQWRNAEEMEDRATTSLGQAEQQRF